MPKKVKNKLMRFGKAPCLAALLIFLSVGGISHAGSFRPEPILVVFNTGDSVIVKGDSQRMTRVTTGRLILKDDQLRVGIGTVDFQSRSGHAIRLQEQSTVKFGRLDRKRTVLKLTRGRAIVKARGSRSRSLLTVLTPTARIQSFRGVFSISLSKAGKATAVRVLSGKVFISPRVRVLEKYTIREIRTNPALRTAAALEKKIIRLKGKTGVALNPKLMAGILQINKVMDGKGPLKAGQIARIAQVLLKDKIPIATTSRIRIGVGEIQESGSLVAVDAATFDGVSGNNNKKRSLAGLFRLHKAQISQQLFD